MLTNASYLAFTATPKNKTLEMFGTPEPQPDGKVRHLPFHNYTMKQAIEEGFIMDVLTNYTPVSRYFNVIKSIDDDPKFDSKRARSKLRRYVENHEYAITQKAGIIIDHFNDSVFTPKRDGRTGKGHARDRRGGPGHQVLPRHQGNHHRTGTTLQGIGRLFGSQKSGGPPRPGSERGPAERVPREQPPRSASKQDPYRILICADKFQTGYDEPLLHTMYVDKHLSGIRAVQTLSRLNRFHPKKSDTFVLDFMNTTEVIQESFGDYYRTTILSDETDPDKLHDLKGGLDQSTGLLPRGDRRPGPEIPGREGDGPPSNPSWDSVPRGTWN